MSTMPTIGTVDLRVEKIAAQYAIPRRMLTLSADEDMMLDQVIYRLVREVVALPGKEEVRAPVSWWDHLKESEVRRSPIMRWWVERHPIHYRTWRAMEMLPRFPELDRYRDTIRVATFVPNYEADHF